MSTLTKAFTASEIVKLHERKNVESIFGFFAYLKYGKFLSILMDHFIRHKPLFSEEWNGKSLYYQTVLLYI